MNILKLIISNILATIICTSLFAQINEADSLRKIAIDLKNKGLYDSAKTICYKSIDLFFQNKDSIGLGNAYNNLGIIFFKSGELLKGFEYLIISEDINKRIQNLPTLQKNQLNLGSIFMQKKDYLRALNYYDNGINLGQFSKTIHLFLLEGKGNALSSLEEYVKAKIIYEQILELTVLPEDKARVYTNIGLLSSRMNDFENSEIEYLKALAILNSQKGSIYDKIVLHLNLGTLYRASLKDYNKAEYHYMEGLKIAEELKHAKYYLDFVTNLSKLKILMKQPTEAENWFNKMTVMRDSVNRLEKQEEFAEMQAKYETENMERELLEQKQIAALALREKNLIFILFGMIAVVFGLIYYSLSNKLKSTKLKMRVKDSEFEKMQIQSKAESLNTIIANLEKERRRFAQDLHDSIGVKLATIKLFNQNKYQPEKVDSLLDDVIKETREISHNVYSGVLEKFGLKAAMNDLLETISEVGSFSVEAGIYLNCELPKELERDVYFIAKELFANAIKYSQAKNVTLSVVIQNTSNLLMIYEDDGIGFIHDQVETGIGLKNIRARVQKHYGELSIDSEPNGGLTIIAELPLEVSMPVAKV